MPTQTTGLSPAMEPRRSEKRGLRSLFTVVRILSTRTSTASSPWIRDSTLRASSSRPAATRKRGDSGIRKEPMP